MGTQEEKTLFVITDRLDKFERMLTKVMEVTAKNAESTSAFLIEARNINNTFNTHIEYLQKENERLRQSSAERLAMLQDLDKRIKEMEIEIARRHFIEEELREIKENIDKPAKPDDFDKRAALWTQANIGKWAIGVACAGAAWLGATLLSKLQIK